MADTGPGAPLNVFMTDAQNTDSLFSWKHSGGARDLPRRFVLGSSKAVGLMAAFIASTESVYVLNYKDFNANNNLNRSLIAFTFLLIGGAVEAAFSHFPKANTKFLPIWNAAIQFLEMLCIETYVASHYLCPRELGEDQTECIDKKSTFLFLASPFVLVLSMLPTFIEYKRYSVNSESKLPCLKKIDLDSKKIKVPLIGFTTTLAFLSFFNIVSNINYFYRADPIPTLAKIMISLTTGAIAIGLEWKENYNNPPSIRKKISYAVTEFVRNSFANYFGAALLTFATFGIYNNITNTKINYDSAYKDMLPFMIIYTALFSIFRSHDSYKFNFFQRKTSASGDIQIDTIGHGDEDTRTAGDQTPLLD